MRRRGAGPMTMITVLIMLLASLSGSAATTLPYDRPWVDQRLALEQADYATFVQDHPPDAYAYCAHVAQAWQAWILLPDGEPDATYNVLTLTGWSGMTLLHAAYESAVGRFSEALAQGRYTPEDAWEARTARQEADDRKTVAWYRFPVWGPLHDLWVNDSPTNVSFPRQLERRYAYTSAYLLQGLGAAIVSAIRPDPARPA